MENMWENTLGTWGTYWEPDGKHGRLLQEPQTNGSL
jgi:hypothetical protein